MIFVDLRSPPISASPTENGGLNNCYQSLLIKCAIYIRPRVDLGVLLLLLVGGGGGGESERERERERERARARERERNEKGGKRREKRE